MDKSYWKPGSQIIIREVLKKKVWTVRPVTVINDSLDFIVLYMSPDTIFKHPRKLDSDEIPQHLLTKDWRLIDKKWAGGGALYISKPNEPYMIIGFRNDDNSEFQRWYVNLQDPFKRTKLGFDYLDMELDIEINKNLSEWHWKDEDKFNNLVTKNIISEIKANRLKEVGMNVANDVICKKSIIENWKSWSPTHSFSIPSVMDGWDNI